MKGRIQGLIASQTRLEQETEARAQAISAKNLELQEKVDKLDMNLSNLEQEKARLQAQMSQVNQEQLRHIKYLERNLVVMQKTMDKERDDYQDRIRELERKL